MRKSIFGILITMLLFAACNQSDKQGLHFKERGREVPAFNADSAYAFLKQQVDFGPRTLNSLAHQKARTYFVKKLTAYAGQGAVFQQRFGHIGYEGDSLKLTNIIAAFNTKASDRIMLCAHWDSRPRADQDSVRVDEPIDGADDGASGVAVLLELARLMSSRLPQIGVDLILFDGEDYGKEGSLDQYFLGSRYWSNHPPVKNYRPRFGILLDMVGGKNARFPQEKYSLQFAPSLVKEIWNIASEKGYGEMFPDKKGAFISDDHVVINNILRIPTIDIVRQQIDIKDGDKVFAPYWHTHNDNLQIIDKHTLKAVGSILAELIYNRI